MPVACRDDRLRFFLYNTACEVVLPGDVNAPALAAVWEDALAVRDLLDCYDPASELSRLNRQGKPALSPALFSVLEALLYAARISGGVYDPTVGPLVRLWDFPASCPRPPAPEAIGAALKRTGFRYVRLRRDSRSIEFLRDGMQLDAGGAGKGYAVDRAVDCLRRYGVHRACVNFGGNLFMLGPGRHADGLWRVGVQAPWLERGLSVGTLLLRDCAVATSGGYDRYFEHRGNVYHHLLDPSTGYPAESGLLSATVVCPSALWADILSTVYFVGGRKIGDDTVQSLRLSGTGYVLVMRDGSIAVSPGLADVFCN